MWSLALGKTQREGEGRGGGKEIYGVGKNKLITATNRSSKCQSFAQTTQLSNCAKRPSGPLRYMPTPMGYLERGVAQLVWSAYGRCTLKVVNDKPNDQEILINNQIPEYPLYPYCN